MIDKQVGRRILKKLNWFSENFETVVPEPLSGEFKGAYKLRVGDGGLYIQLKVRS